MGGRSWSHASRCFGAGGFALRLPHTAVDGGLGTRFFGITPEEPVAFRAEFGIPEAYEHSGRATRGHRAHDPASQSTAVAQHRRDPDDAVLRRTGQHRRPRSGPGRALAAGGPDGGRGAPAGADAVVGRVP
ncbi:hypothetical protein [Streptomyces sp. NPDC092129]|uniref:hypothetical protein n=1 Tax=Streptomyces sp. NPDC092129 TaxID=3366010 RepID=UPI0038157698